MLNTDKLEAERMAAAGSKKDLFKFYHSNWDALLIALIQAQETAARSNCLQSQVLGPPSKN